jgi:putative iron-only hydrogenase system regulator
MGGFFRPEGGFMESKRIAVAAIVIDEPEAAVEVNAVLHEYNDIIIGRMGVPYKERGISLISVAIDAEPDVISSLTGRLGQISGVSVKAAISKK